MGVWQPPELAIRRLTAEYAVSALGNRETPDGDLFCWAVRGRMILADRLPMPKCMGDVKDSTVHFLRGNLYKAEADIVAATTGMISPFDRHGVRIDKTTAPELLATAVSVANMSLFFAVATGIIGYPPPARASVDAAAEIMKYWFRHNELGRKLMAAARFLPKLTDQQRDVAACVRPSHRKRFLPWLTLKRSRDAAEVQGDGAG